MADRESVQIENPIRVAFDVPMQRVMDLLSCALDTPNPYGAGYWAELIEEVGKLDNPTEPGRMVFAANCDGEPYTHSNGLRVFVLDAASLQRGLSLFPAFGGQCFTNWMNDNEDGAAGDVFLQLCLFGEVVFA